MLIQQFLLKIIHAVIYYIIICSIFAHSTLKDVGMLIVIFLKLDNV